MKKHSIDAAATDLLLIKNQLLMSKRPCGRGAWSDGETLVAAASFLPSCSVGEERAERDFLMRQGRTQQQREEKEDVHKRLACGSRVLELSCYGRA